MFKNTKWRDLIPILWILFYSSEINKKTQLTTESLVCFFGSNGPSHGFGGWTFGEENAVQVAQDFTRHFLSLKYVFLLNVLLYLLVIFWKTRIDIYITWRKYMRRTFKCTCTDIDLHQKNLHSPNPLHPCLVPHQ